MALKIMIGAVVGWVVLVLVLLAMAACREASTAGQVVAPTRSPEAAKACSLLVKPQKYEGWL